MVSDWGAQKIDDDLLYTVIHGYSKNLIDEGLFSSSKNPNWFYAHMQGGGAAWSADAEGNLNSQNKMSLAAIAALASWARQNNIVPCMFNGRSCYVLLMSTYQMHDLKQDPAWVAMATHARPAGDNHPFWTGAFGMYDGVYCIETPKITSPPASDAVADYDNIKRALFLGAHAVGFGVADESKYTTLNEDDMQKDLGRGIQMIYGARRADWLLTSDSSTTVNQSSAVLSTYARAPFTAGT
jgi:N4-gp56 family major capsid protein